MKIAIFTDTFLPQVNGIVTATLNLAKGLADKGHKIYIIAPKFKNFKNEFKYKNIEIKRVSSIPAKFYEDFKFTSPFSLKLLKFLRKEKINLIHFQTPIMLGLEAIIISKILKIPLVGTFHTFFADPEYLKHVKINYKFIQTLSWKYSSIYYNQCNLITCPSETTKKELIHNGFTQPIQVISNGIDPKIFDNSKWKEVKNKYNQNGKILLFVGRIAHEKNIFYLLDCFKLVLKKIPDVKLMIVGDGPQMGELKDRIKSLGIQENIILTGKIEHKELVKSSIFKACDLFVTASLTETQGISTLEAQANGLPCVAIGKRGIRDLIKNNYNGILVNDKNEFADAVVRIILDEELYKKMKNNTLKEIKKHDLSNVIKIWEKEYNNLRNKEKN